MRENAPYDAVGATPVGKQKGEASWLRLLLLPYLDNVTRTR